MDSINLSIPFMALSTKVNCLGEIEKRFVTPFGMIDVLFPNILDMEKEKPRITIEVGGDAEYWESKDSATSEFRAALLHFVWGMITEGHLEKGIRMDSSKVNVCLKGSEGPSDGQYENMLSGEMGGDDQREWL